jgi:hypothetical protein
MSNQKKQKKEKKIGLFDLIKHLNEETENKWEMYSSVFSQYMLNKFFSMHPETLGFAEIANKIKVSDYELYLFYLYGLPKKRRYIKYVKTLKPDEEMQSIMDKYQITHEKAKRYKKMMESL